MFGILVHVEGYQPIKIRNYYAVPDQISSCEIILEPGTDTVYFDTHPDLPSYPRNGIDTEYYETGAIECIVSYRNYNVTKAICFHDNGVLDFSIGKMEDSIYYNIERYENKYFGNVRFCNYNNSGFENEFYANGQLKKEIFFSPNLDEYIIWTIQDSLGNFIVKNGNTVKQYFWKNKMHNYEGRYKNGLLNGRVVFFNEDGTKDSKYYFRKGKAIRYKYYKSKASN